MVEQLFDDLKELVGGQTASGLPAIEVIPTGIKEFDKILGIGGIPRGKLVEFFGAESSGKTTLAKVICSSVHRAGGTVAWVDAEGAFDVVWAEKIGMDLDRTLMLEDYSCGEEAYQIMCLALGKVDLLVVDSIARLNSRWLRDRDRMGNPKIAANALMNSLGLGDLFNGGVFEISDGKTKQTIKTPKLRQTRTAIIFTNHIRDKIGGYSEGIDTPGGHALKHDATIRVKFRIVKISQEKDDEGNPEKVQAEVFTKKNKAAPPLRTVDFWIGFNGRVGSEISMVGLANEKGLVSLAERGGWIKSKFFPDGKSMQRKDFEAYLETDEGTELKRQILEE